MHTLIEPSTFCRRHHRIDTRPKAIGGGKYEYCVHCTLGYEKALHAFDGNEHLADAFIQDLRRHA